MSFLFRAQAEEKGGERAAEHDPEISVSDCRGMGNGEFPEKVKRVRGEFSGKKLALNDFKLCATLGTGTFGRVRLAKYTLSGDEKESCFALKMLKKKEIIRLKQVDHIRSEREILTRISHPFIVDLYGTYQDDIRVYMIMEYVIGGELFSQLRSAGRFNNEASRFFAAEITLALQYLHTLDIVYRDLKPENLLIDRDGHIKITDFGFAKVVDDRTWTLCGTPEYLAPGKTKKFRTSFLLQSKIFYIFFL